MDYADKLPPRPWCTFTPPLWRIITPPLTRREFVLMSAEQYDWLRASAQRSHRTDDAADVVIDAVERAEMDGEHKPRDDLLT